MFQANCTASLCLTAVRVINGRRWEHKKCDKTLRSCTDPGDMSCTHLSDDRCAHDDNKLRLVSEDKEIFENVYKSFANEKYMCIEDTEPMQ